jgi:hypothetical protein
MVKVRMSRNDMVKAWLEKPHLDSCTVKRLRSLRKFHALNTGGRYMDDIDACSRELIAMEIGRYSRGAC